MMTEQNSFLTPESTLVVSGGARGITAKCMESLVKRCPCKLILLGRSQLLDSLPEWVENSMDEADIKRKIMQEIQARGEKAVPALIQREYGKIHSHLEINRTKQSLLGYGAVVEYISVDITNEDELRQKLKEPIQRLGPVSGIIHGAGNLADKLIEKKTFNDYEKVLGPKITGLKNLFMVIPPEQLDLVVLFSSVVGFYGNAGQADYALANEILNKTAYLLKRRHPDLNVVSFNWGPWEAGMVTDDLKRAFRERGVDLISMEDGPRIFTETLINGKVPGVQLLVGNLPRRPVETSPQNLLSVQVKRHLKRHANPFLEDHVIGGYPVLPATCGSAWMVNACEQFFPGYSFLRLENFKVLKGIVFDQTLSGEYNMSISQVLSGRDDEIHCETEVSSISPKGTPVYHYRQKTILAAKLPGDIQKANEKPDFGSPIQSDVSLYSDGTLFHGASFQGVQDLLSIDSSGLFMKARLAALSLEVQGQFPVWTVNPFLNDAIVQALLIWTQKMDQAPCLPSRAESLDQFIPIRFDQDYWVELKVRSHTSTSVLGDLIVSDKDGQTCLNITGLEGTISKQLKRFLGSRPAEELR